MCSGGLYSIRAIISVRTCENTISLHKICERIKYKLCHRVRSQDRALVDVVSILRLIHIPHLYRQFFLSVIEFRIWFCFLLSIVAHSKGVKHCGIVCRFVFIKTIRKTDSFSRFYVDRCYFIAPFAAHTLLIFKFEVDFHCFLFSLWHSLRRIVVRKYVHIQTGKRI